LDHVTAINSTPVVNIEMNDDDLDIIRPAVPVLMDMRIE